MILLYLAALAGAGQAEGPRAFVHRIYSGYERHDYNPLDRVEDVFAPALAAAIREDARLAGGEVGYLDGDPLCDCQDYLKLTAHIRSLKRPDPQHATARMRVSLGFDHDTILTLQLLMTPAGWRIADVVSAQGSLLAALTKANSEQ